MLVSMAMACCHAGCRCCYDYCIFVMIHDFFVGCMLFAGMYVCLFNRLLMMTALETRLSEATKLEQDPLFQKVPNYKKTTASCLALTMCEDCGG